MRRRPDFYKLRDLIPKSNLDEKTVAILADFEKYYENHPSHKEIDLTTFVPRFHARHPGMKQELVNQYNAVFRNAWSQDADEDQRKTIMHELAELELATKLANIAERHNDGTVADLFHEVTSSMDGFRSRMGLRSIQYIDTPIGELLQDEFNDAGVAWRLDCLNRSMRRLRPGDFGIIAGRPDKGKTTFLTSEVTFFAPQLPADRNIIWLNNEGPGRRITPRLYQSALNFSMDEMKQEQSKPDANGKHDYGHSALVDAYRKAVTRLDKIRIIDVHGFNTGQIEAILEEGNPGVIIYDMIDNIRGFASEARTDLALEEMYKWARERSVKYDCIGLATSQISNDGDGMQFPTLGMLKDSKTGKQGACDFQLMIGASNDVGLSGSRFMSLPKNKLRRPDGQADPRAEVIFDGLRARYKDIPIGI
jgi:replicative DNA helicase